jgi:outer membrane protein OmpA-like peptidoglycan-associated protein
MIRSLLLCMLLTIPCTAQLSQWQFGIFGAGALNMHHGTITTTDGLIECGTFQDATSPGWMAGNIIQANISGPWGASARLFYHKADGTFTAPNDVQPYTAMSDGTLVRMTTEYELQTQLDYIDLDILATYAISPVFFVGLGPQFGLNTRAGFEQQETILSPSSLEFRTGGTTRVIQSSTFPNATAFRFAATAVVGAVVPVSARLTVQPEIGYTHAFTTVVDGNAWRVHDVRLGASLLYSFDAPESTPSTAAAPPPASAPAPTILPEPVLTVELESVATDGTIRPYGEVLVQETRSLDIVPLLPYVFFDVQSAAIPSRYRAARSTDPAMYVDDVDGDSTIGIYYNILNIVGARMTQNASAKITLTGCREPNDKEIDTTLSERRALAVKNYLMSTWNIAADRITVTSRVLPLVASNVNVADGRAENRRVELVATHDDILAPVRQRSVQRQLEPATVDLKPSIAHPERIAAWSAHVRDNTAATLFASNGTGAPTARIAWAPAITDIVRTLGAANDASLRFELTASTPEGGQVRGGGSVPVHRIVRSTRYNGEVVKDSVIERFGLIFFDFDSPNVNDRQRSMLDLVRSRIRTNSSLRVTGLTDRIGSASYNTSLSQRRAESVLASIQERIVPAQSSAIGAGPTLIHDNDLPEGRCYNRTVLLEVATPVE